MPEAANIKKDPTIAAIEQVENSVVRPMWEDTKTSAGVLQSTAKGIFHWIPGSGKIANAWNGYSDGTKSTIKKVASFGAGVGTAIGVAAFAPAAAAAVAGAGIIGAGVGAYQTRSWSGVKTGAAMGAGAAAVVPAVAGAALGALPAAVPAAVGTALSALPAAVGTVAGYIGTAASAAPAVAGAALSGVPALTVAGVAGAATAAHRIGIAGEPVMSGIYQGIGAVAVAGGAALLAGPALATGAVLGIGPAATTLMATHPNSTVIAQIPQGATLEYDTPGSGERVAKPSQVITDITGKLVEFRRKQPLVWEEPQTFHEEFVNKLPKDTQKEVLRTLNGLPINSTQQEMELALEAILKKEGAMPASKADLAPILKVLEPRMLPKDFREAKVKTDQQLEALIENSSIFSTIYFMHVVRLNQKQTPEVSNAINEIIKKATQSGKKEDLWDLYRAHKYLGASLSKMQWLRAKFWYFILHTVGAAQKGLGMFLTKFVNSFRNIEDKNAGQLNDTMNKLLQRASTVLSHYNAACRKFAAEGKMSGRSLNDYIKEEIGKLGDDDLLRKAEKREGNKNLGDKMMDVLCEEFAYMAIDEFIPDIPLFEKSFLGVQPKNIPIIGYLFKFLDWGINQIVRKVILRQYLPGVVSSLAETGLEQTLPEQYALKVNLTNLLREQLEELQKDLDPKKIDTSRPIRLNENDFIDGTVDRVLETLAFKKDGKDPLPDQMAERIREYDNGGKNDEIRTELRKLMVMGSKQLMHRYSHQPVAVEQLFSNLLQASNEAFSPDTPVRTQEDYDQSKQKLEDVAFAMIETAVNSEVDENVVAPRREKAIQFLQGKRDEQGNVVEKGLILTQKENAEKSFAEMQLAAQSMDDRLNQMKNLQAQAPGHVLKDLDRYAKNLGKFAVDAKEMDIMDDVDSEKKLYWPIVQNAFNKTYQPIYRHADALAAQVVGLQDPMMIFDKYHQLQILLKELDGLVQGKAPQGQPATGVQDPSFYMNKLKKIQEIADLYPGLAQTEFNRQLQAKIDQMQAHIQALDAAVKRKAEERKLINQLAALGSPATFGDRLLGDPQGWVAKTREMISLRDQNPLFLHIRDLQMKHKLTPKPDLSAEKALIAADLQSILERHHRLYQSHSQTMQTSLTAFQAEAQEANRVVAEKRDAYSKDVENRLVSLKRDTAAILARTRNIESEVPDLNFPVQYLHENTRQLIRDDKGKPMIEKIKPVVKDAQKLMADHWIYNGSTRALMGELIRTYKKS